MRKYDIIYADPPWHYRGRRQFGFAGDVGVDTGGSVMHYKTLSVNDIMRFRVADIAAENSLLFIWIPGPMLDDGYKVVEAWGFKLATVGFVWDKMRTNPGYYTLSQCEICYVAKRGKIPQPRGSRNERQLVTQKRSKHSAKPDEVRKRIGRMFPTQRKIELFARDRVDGWDCFGDEVESDITLQL